MAGHAAGRTRATKRFMAMGAADLIDMVSTEIAGRPERGGTSNRSPANPHDQHQSRQRDHRHRGSRKGKVAHHSRHSGKEQSPCHMQNSEQHKHEGHRRVDCLPNAERFLLGGHPVQVRVDVAVRQALMLELMALLVERPQAERMHELSDDSAENDDDHRDHRENRNDRVIVGSGVEKNKERSQNPSHHVDSKPIARPPSRRAQSLAKRIHKHQEGQGQSCPPHDMAIPRMPERCRRIKTEQGLKEERAGDCSNHDRADGQDAPLQRCHGGYSSLFTREPSVAVSM